jgi:hypothetical protein
LILIPSGCRINPFNLSNLFHLARREAEEQERRGYLALKILNPKPLM